MKKNSYKLVIPIFIVLTIIVTDVLVVKKFVESNTKEPIKVVEVITKQQLKEDTPIDLSKCLNNPKDDKERTYSIDKIIAINEVYDNNKFEISENKKSVTIITGLKKTYYESGLLKTIENENPTTIEITGFNTKVKQVLFNINGNGGIPNKILFLLEDGTVEYIDIQYINNKITENESTYYIETITGISELKTIPIANIVTLYNGGIYVTGDTDGNTTVLASTNDGSFYNLNYVFE